jgi:ketosteroid isomerase-like protein
MVNEHGRPPSKLGPQSERDTSMESTAGRDERRETSHDSPLHLPPASADAAQAAEDRFFHALVAGDVEQLTDVLAADFAIVDVMSGALTQRTAFLEAFRGAHLVFSRVDVVERYTRIHGGVAIIVGRTEMAGAYDGNGFAASSRYTHVIVLGADGQWRLETAQGTRILET